MAVYKGYRALIVYQKSYELSMEIFDIVKSFPPEEKYSLTDQLKRSSRAVPANISAAWVRRQYPKFFISKLLDALEEQAESEVWLDFAKDCKYLDEKLYSDLKESYSEVARMLASMVKNPEKFTGFVKKS